MSNINGVSNSPVVTVPRASAPSITPAPTHHLKTSTSEGLVFLLRTSFEKFSDPSEPGVISRESLAKKAYSPEGNSDSIYESQLAREVLERNRLFEQLDGFGEHKQDGKITQESLGAFEAKENGRFSTMNDKEIGRYFFDNFNNFRYLEPLSESYREELGVPTLESAATSSTSGSEKKMFARELLGRPELLEQLGLGYRSARVTRGDVEQALPTIK